MSLIAGGVLPAGPKRVYPRQELDREIPQRPRRQVLVAGLVGAAMGLVVGGLWHVYAGIGCADQDFMGCRGMNELLLVMALPAVWLASGTAMLAARVVQPFELACLATLSAFVAEWQLPGSPIIDGADNLVLLATLGFICASAAAFVLLAPNLLQRIATVWLLVSAVVAVGWVETYVQQAQIRAVGFTPYSAELKYWRANPAYIVKGDSTTIHVSQTSNGYSPTARNSISIDTQLGTAAGLCLQSGGCEETRHGVWVRQVGEETQWLVNKPDGVVVTVSAPSGYGEGDLSDAVSALSWTTPEQLVSPPDADDGD